MIDEARTKGAKDHFASLMDIGHLKNAELEAKHQKYKGRVVLRGDTVKDDSGCPGGMGSPILQEIRRTQNQHQVEHWCFWKSYICSNKLHVLDTNLSFAQFNRIRNHFFGCRIEIGRDSRSRFVGSDCFCPWKHKSEP